MAANPEFRRWWAAYLQDGRQSCGRRRTHPHELRGRYSKHPTRYPRSHAGGSPHWRPVPVGGREAVTWRAASRAPASSNSPESITYPSSATRKPSSMKWRNSSPAFAIRPAPNLSWPPYCQPPFNCRAMKRVDPLRGCGSACATTSIVNSPGPGDATAARALTACWPASMVPPVQSAVPLRLRITPPASAFACAPDCTSESVKSRAVAFGAPLWKPPARSRTRPARQEILVSATVRDLVAGSGLRFQPKGDLDLGGGLSYLPFLTVDSGDGY